MAFQVLITSHSAEGAEISGTTDEVLLHSGNTEAECRDWISNMCNDPTLWPYNGAWEPTVHGNLEIREV